MNIKSFEEIRNSEVIRKRPAKAMARDCFRNTKLADFHAGTFPSSEADDYSVVKVVSPYGEIEWNKLGHLSDEKMRTLMIDAVNHCYDFLTVLCSPFGETIVEHLKQHDVLPHWKGAGHELLLAHSVGGPHPLPISLFSGDLAFNTERPASASRRAYE